jgi:energy-coupling factor transporter ATP-binding protein EcfA2
MKVAILGAPGSGKSKLAKKLATHMAKDDGFKRPAIVDNYMGNLEGKTGYSYGVGATPQQNLQIIFYRWTLEQEVENRGLDSVTCGTLYESFLYAVLKSKLLEEVEGVNPVDMIQERTTMEAIGMLERTIYDYDAIFYLPYDGQTILEKGRSYDIAVDQKIPEVLEGYFKNHVRLDETERANVKHAITVIRTIRSAQAHAEQVAKDEQQTVRGSGEVDITESEEFVGVPDMRVEAEGSGSGDL